MRRRAPTTLVTVALIAACPLLVWCTRFDAAPASGADAADGAPSDVEGGALGNSDGGTLPSADALPAGIDGGTDFFCDNFDESLDLTKWPIRSGPVGVAPTGFSPPNALNVDISTNGGPAFVGVNVPKTNKVRITMRLNLTTSDTQGNVDVLAVLFLNGADEYALSLARSAGGGWSIEEYNKSGGNEDTTHEDISGGIGPWSLVEIVCDLQGGTMSARVDQRSPTTKSIECPVAHRLSGARRRDVLRYGKHQALQHPHRRRAHRHVLTARARRQFVCVVKKSRFLPAGA